MFGSLIFDIMAMELDSSHVYHETEWHTDYVSIYIFKLEERYDFDSGHRTYLRVMNKKTRKEKLIPLAFDLYASCARLYFKIGGFTTDKKYLAIRCYRLIGGLDFTEKCSALNTNKCTEIIYLYINLKSGKEEYKYIYPIIPNDRSSV